MMSKFSLLATFFTISLSAFTQAFSFAENMNYPSGHDATLWHGGAKEAVKVFCEAVDSGMVDSVKAAILDENTAVFQHNGGTLVGPKIFEKFKEKTKGVRFEKQFYEIKCFATANGEIQVEGKGWVRKNQGDWKNYTATMIIKDCKVKALQSESEF